MSKLNDIPRPPSADALDEALHTLGNNKHVWARTSLAARVAMLKAMKESLMPQARAWALTAAGKKGIPAGSPLVGEEWLSGPYALLTALDPGTTKAVTPSATWPLPTTRAAIAWDKSRRRIPEPMDGLRFSVS